MSPSPPTRCPFAIYLPLPENKKQPLLLPVTQLIVHTAVDAPGKTDLEKYFARADVGAESHFWLQRDGRLVQMMDLNRQANANRHADVRAISIETEDDGNPEGIPWTQAQINTLLKLANWLCDNFPIPRRQIDLKDHKSPGIGWHAMFGFKDPIRQTGPIRDNPWSFAYAKTCPGKTRISQFRNVIMPAITRGIPNMFVEVSRGDNGTVVLFLQILLNKFSGANLVEDGSFGPETEAALKVYQTSIKVPATGKWDETTNSVHNFLNSDAVKNPGAPPGLTVDQRLAALESTVAGLVARLA